MFERRDRSLFPYPMPERSEMRGTQHHWGSSGRKCPWIEDLSRGTDYPYNRQALPGSPHCLAQSNGQRVLSL